MYVWGSDVLTPLIGKTITKIYMDEDTLVFEVLDALSPGGVTNIAFYVDGDCCSHSYFTELVNVKALLDSVVTEVGDSNYSGRTTEAEDEYDNCIQAYPYKIVTSAGEATLVFENSSNGYYGGSLHQNDNTSTGKLEPLIEDFSRFKDN